MDIVSDLAGLAARCRDDGELCRAAAARVEALHDLRWRSSAAALFRERAACRAGHLREVASGCELLASWADRLGATVRRAEEGG